jgi:hypothetical protein
MIDLLINLANSLASLSGQLRSVRRERRDRIADLLANIAECIGDIADQFRASNNVPRRRCFELKDYLQHLEFACTKVIADERLSDLVLTLERAVHGPRNLLGLLYMDEAQWKQLSEHEANDVRENALHRLDYAAGSFRATANLLRASPRP